MTTPLRVAFIGLGNMGRPMARNLLAAGIPVSVWNRTRSHAEDLAAHGARLAATPADAAGAADVAISMVADDRALESVVGDGGGLLAGLQRDAIHLSMSTISVEIAERLTESHAAAGSIFVSAPVFGRPEAAADRKLFVVAAGPPTALDRCQSLFDAVGQRTFRVGERPSAANVVKLSGNFLIASVIEALGEAFALTRKSGIDPALYLDLLTSTLFTAPVYKTYGSLIAARKYQPAGFKMVLGLKDVSLVLDAARSAAVPMPFASVVRDHLLAGIAQGGSDDDWSAVAEIAARAAGIGD
jgi:3-hydroxyisobutyrate dehydrogenase-like beta-hydroxyacid dehydrogenase